MTAYDCSTTSNFSVVQTASDYSQFAGLLAGLSFTALVIIYSQLREHGPVRHGDSLAATMLSSFFSFVVACFLYATLGGDAFPTSRSTAVNILASLALVCALLGLLFGITIMFVSAGTPTTRYLAVATASLLLPLLAYLYISITILDAMTCQQQISAPRQNDVILLAVIGGVWLVLAGAALLNRANVIQKVSGYPTHIVTWGALLIIALLSIIAAFVFEAPVDIELSRVLLFGIATALGGYLAAYSVAVWAILMRPPLVDGAITENT